MTTKNIVPIVIIPQGVCSKLISFNIVDGETIENVTFKKGCKGGMLGVSKLIEGMEIEDVISKLKGITCHSRCTSCPDQLAIALENITN